MSFAYKYPNIDPFIFKIGAFGLRWYSLSYIIGFICCKFFVKQDLIKDQEKIKVFTLEKLDDLAIKTFLSIILGARLFFVLFYNFHYYCNNVSDIFKIWSGGLSLHGGFAGALVAVYFCSRKIGISPAFVLDRCAVSVPVALFFGRISNFINAELYGRPTNSWVGMSFPFSDFVPRHPSQLYEAFFEGIVLFAIMLYLFYKTKLKNINYALLSCCVFFYSLFRFFIEFFREPDQEVGLIFNIFSLGQILCFIFGMSFVFFGLYSFKKSKSIDS